MRKLVLSLSLVLLATTVHGADLDVVRKNFVDYYAAANADPAAPRMQNALWELEAATKAYTAAGYLLSDGSWSDVTYTGIPDGNWGPWDHTRRLIVLAKAYRTPGQSFYRSAPLRAQIDAALAYTKRFYGATIIPSGNWWFWTIGIPIDLAPTLVLMRGEVDPQTYDDLVLAIHLRIGNSPTAKGLIGPTPTGQNLVWSAFTHLCLGLLKDDPAMLAAVRDAMTSVARPVTGLADGLMADSSFHQHGAQLYTGGYGGQFANDVTRYALLARGTSFALPPDAMASFVDYLADGVAWSLFGNYFDVSVVGREVARSSTSGYNGLAALLQASTFESARSAEIRSAAAKMLQTWNGTFPTELAALTVQVARANYWPLWPSGHRHYFTSDYTIHRREGWFASVKMFSRRTKSGENTNNENILGSRQSDGRFSLSLNGNNEYFGRDVFPVLDWTRLPGITVEQRPNAADATYGYGTRTFAGGTGDGKNGVSAMELAPLGSQMTAKKAWFFFDDSIAFLTNSITSPSAYRVETVVNQWPLVSASSQLVRENDWASLENVGYWFPTPVSLKTSRETRSGTWAALGGSTDTTQRSAPIVTMWLDHGVTPANATAEYVIVANISTSAMRTWAASRPLTILANTKVVSAVRDNRTGTKGIVFWGPGSIDGISSNAAALLYLAGDSLQMTLTAADPNAGATGTMTIELPGTWYTKDASFSTSNARSTVITIPRAGGQTTTVKLQRILRRRSA